MKNEIDYKKVKEQALVDFGVVKFEEFNAKKAIRDRVDYLKNYISSNGLKSIVLGISGGVDSSTAGKLSQIAMSELRDECYDARFVAVRLPSGVQKDESDAQEALKFISPDVVHTVNIGDSSNMISEKVVDSFETLGSNLDDMLQIEDFEEKIDFHRGNVKARMRMIAQYQLAAIYGGVVLGTDHNAEGLLAFYTKFGDGACDLIVLNGLNKRQVRACAKELGAPEWLYNKVATADLEDLKEQVPDEVATGIPYDVIDDFLEGKEIEPEMENKILDHHISTAHKRALPVSF
jgi:NAD+ synthase